MAAAQLRMGLVHSYAADDPRRIALMYSTSVLGATIPYAARYFYNEPWYSADQVLPRDELRWLIRTSDMVSVTLFT